MTAPASNKGTVKGTRPASTPRTKGVDTVDTLSDENEARMARLEAGVIELKQMLATALADLRSLPRKDKGVQ